MNRCHSRFHGHSGYAVVLVPDLAAPSEAELRLPPQAPAEPKLSPGLPSRRKDMGLCRGYRPRGT